MTTKEAEARYLRDHLRSTSGAPDNVYNPNGVPIEELPVIYGFNAGENPVGFTGRIVSQDGVFLGGHCCSHEGYMRSDLGMIPDSHREKSFREYYPDGFRTEFVSLVNVPTHEGLQAALRLAAQKEEKS